MRSIVVLWVLLVASASAVAEPFDIAGNLRALHKDGHPAAAAEIATANRTDVVYGDQGQHDVFAWAMTGERKYLDDAVPKLLKGLTINPLPSANHVREYFAEFAILYRLIRDDLTKEQQAEFRSRFMRWCEFSCGINTPKYVGGWNYADSDATTGQYLGLVLCDDIFDWRYTQRTDGQQARSAIRSYVLKAAGGEWIESSGYNIGTLQILLLGCYGAGIENFPEVEALLPDLVEQQLAILTPDSKASYQWGDEENPRSLLLHRRIALFGLLIGLTGDHRLQEALDKIMVGKAYKDYANLSWRLCYFYQPPFEKRLRASTGNGHFIYKRDDAMLCVHFPRRLVVQHEVSYTADLQLWHKGEWVLTRPLGYAGDAVSGTAGNSPLFAGLSSMQFRGPTKYRESAIGCEIQGGTFGDFYDGTYYKPPRPFLEKHSRSVTFRHPSTITVVDSFKGQPPLDVAQYRAADQALIKSSPLWQQVWHCPVEPTETKAGFTWQTQGGQTVVLTTPVNCKRAVLNESEKWAAAKSNFQKSELKWQIRFCSDEPACEMITVFEVR